MIRKIVLIPAFILMLLIACTKKEKNQEFDYAKAAGIWVPYQAVHANGDISPGPFNSATIFGIYAESVNLNADRTFIPVIWTDSSNYFFKTEEKSTYHFQPGTHKLIFAGSPGIETELVGFQENDLTLKIHGTIYMFSRKY